MATQTEIERLIVRVVGDVSGFTAPLETAMRATTNFASTITTLLSQMATSVISSITAAFSAFELEMSRIEGLVGISHAQVMKFAESITRLGPALGKSPQELAEGLYFITSAGFKSAQSIDILTASAKASTAGLGTTKVIADAVTSAVNAYAKSGLTAAYATDVMTAAVREGKMEASSLASVMGRLLPLTSAMGVGFADVAGSLAAMSRIGATAQEATSSINSLLLGLQKPTKDAVEILSAFGLSFDTLRQTIKKPGGIIEVLRLVAKTFGENDEAIAKVFPNMRAIRGVLNLLSQDARSVDEVMKGVRDSVGDTERAFEIASQTLSFKWQQAMATVSTATIQIGESFKPVLTELTQAIRTVTMAWGSLSSSTKEFIVTTITLVAALAPLRLAMVVVGLIGTTLVNVFRGLITLGFIPLYGSIHALVTHLLGMQVGLTNLGIAMVATRAAAIILAGGGFVILGSAIIQAHDALKHFNAETERSNRINNELNSILEKRRKATTGNIEKLELRAQRPAFSKELETASKALGNSAERIDQLKKKLQDIQKIRDQFPIPFLDFAGQAAVTGVTTELEQEIKKFQDLQKAVDELKKKLEELGNKAEEKGRIDPGILTNMVLLGISMRDEMKTTGMNADQKAIYALATKLATEETRLFREAVGKSADWAKKLRKEIAKLREGLADLKAQAQQLKDIASFQQMTKETKDWVKELDAQAATFLLSADRARVYRLRLDGLSGTLLAAVDAALDTKESLEKLKQQMEDGARITEEFSSPMEKFAERLEHLNTLYDENFISLDVYNRALDDAVKKFSGGTREIQKFDAALVGSAESASRWNQYMEMMNPAATSMIGNRAPLPTGLGSLPGGLKVRTGSAAEAAENEARVVARAARQPGPTIPPSSFPPFDFKKKLSGLDIAGMIFEGVKDAIFAPPTPEQILQTLRTIMTTFWKGFRDAILPPWAPPARPDPYSGLPAPPVAPWTPPARPPLPPSDTENLEATIKTASAAAAAARIGLRNALQATLEARMAAHRPGATRADKEKLLAAQQAEEAARSLSDKTREELAKLEASLPKPPEPVAPPAPLEIPPHLVPLEAELPGDALGLGDPVTNEFKEVFKQMIDWLSKIAGNTEEGVEVEEVDF